MTARNIHLFKLPEKVILFKKVLIYTAYIFIIISGHSYSYNDPIGQKNILILNSGESFDFGVLNIIRSIKLDFSDSMFFPRITIEDLKLKNFKSSEYLGLLSEFIKKKYTKTKFDVIITIGYEALEFVDIYRNELFKDIPVVCSDIGNNNDEVFDRIKNITGIITDFQFDKGIDVFLDLHSDRKSILVLYDSAPSSIALKNLFNQKTSSENSLHYILMDELDQHELIQHIKEYESDGVVFLLGTIKDSLGNYFTLEKTALFISGHADIPIYCINNLISTNAIVGFYFNNYSNYGVHIAKAVKRILQGEDISNIPIVHDNKLQYFFDYNLLQKFNIEEDQLPKNRIIKNKPLSFWNKQNILLILEGVISFFIILFLIINILKRRKTEKALRESKERYESLYQNAPVGIYRTAPDGKVHLANPTIIKMLGYESFDDLLERNLEKEGFEAGYDRNIYKELIEKHGFVKDFHSIWKRKDGKIIHILENARAIKDQKGNVYYEGIAEDITEKKKAEAELQKYIGELKFNKNLIEKNAKELTELNIKLSESENKLKKLNRSKDKFFSIISHDLRSPFNSLIGFSDLLANNYDELTADEVKEIIININNSLRNLYKLIENILQWSGLQTGKMEYKPTSIDLKNIVEEVKGLLVGSAVKKSISINNLILNDTFVYVDRFMLHSILQNLISNSIKFTKADGRIHISSIDTGKFIEVTVSDTGIGMRKDQIEKLFRIDNSISRSGTAGEKGTGLGLIICKELIEKNGGEIRVRSTPDKLTEFIFTMPKYF